MTRKDYKSICIALVYSNASYSLIEKFAIRLSKYYPNIDLDKFRDYAAKLIKEKQNKTGSYLLLS